MKLVQKLGAKNTYSKSAPNSRQIGKPLSTTTPSGGAGFALSSKQSSGRTTHSRSSGMNIAGKGENLNGMPAYHG